MLREQMTRLSDSSPNNLDQSLTVIDPGDHAMDSSSMGVGSRLCENGAPIEPAPPEYLDTHERQHSPRSRSGTQPLDVSPFLSMGQRGSIDTFGPSSALQVHLPRPAPTQVSMSTKSIKDSLIANAALSRQHEHELYRLPDVDGVPTELASHLFDQYWNTTYQIFLLGYRPVVISEFIHGGPRSSRFLVNAIFACASQFSQRQEVYDDPGDRSMAGGRFFRRCDELLHQDGLLAKPTIPTVSGLLIVGMVLLALGETSKGWLYTGFALRMVYDLGLHLNRQWTGDEDHPEDIEIRRRVFWAAFIYDKMQSLYLGRPMAIRLRDAHVSLQLFDTFEEGELHVDYIDPMSSIGLDHNHMTATASRTPTHAVSCFQQLCLLSRIMTKVIDGFYVVGATADLEAAIASFEVIDSDLVKWAEKLPVHLQLRLAPEESTTSRVGMRGASSPNILNLHALYQSLTILLHRPFIAHGHLHSATAPATSWKRSTIAAKTITSIASAYRALYNLRTAAYLLGYALYVACTIHLRNAGATSDVATRSTEHASLLALSLTCLKEMEDSNCGVKVSLNIIQNMVAVQRLDLLMVQTDQPQSEVASASVFDPGGFDMDAIYAAFPSSLVAELDLPKEGDDTALLHAPNHDVARYEYDDLLYGFMDDQFSAVGDFTQWSF